MSVVDTVGTAPGDLQSTYRALGPMTWRRGDARFEDPHGRVIAPAKANSASRIRLVASEEYELQAGTATASQLALDLSGVAGRPGAEAAEAVRFIRRWGLLQNGPGGPLHERWEDFRENSTGLLHLFGYWHAIKTGNDAFLDDLRSSTFWHGVRASLGLPDVSSAAFSDQLQAFIATALTGAIQQCDPSVVAVGPATLAISMNCRTLYARAFYEAATLLAWREPLRECAAPDCGRFFVMEDPRTIFCSSQCGERIKRRRYRAKRRLEARA